MYNLELKNGLLYTSLIIVHEGQSVTINDVIIDTGAFHTILCSDFIEELGSGFSDDDIIVEASGYGGTVCFSVRKRINSVKLNDIELEDFKIDFGEIDPNEKINGLLGLDFLRKAGIILDLDELTMYKKYDV